MNPSKCSFGVQAEKFIRFILKKRGIDANLDRCQIVIDMRNPTNIKEVQQLTCHLVTLSSFNSYTGHKTFLIFVSLKKNKRFKWTKECKEDFSKIKSFFTSPPILSRPREGPTLLLYLSVTNPATSSLLVQEIDKS